MNTLYKINRAIAKCFTVGDTVVDGGNWGSPGQAVSGRPQGKQESQDRQYLLFY